MSLYCPHCDGDMHEIGESRRAPKRRGGPRMVTFLCDHCGRETDLKPPDHVVIRHPTTVECRVCGVSYAWATPVPFSIFIAGNSAFGWEHHSCIDQRAEILAELIAVLKVRMRILLYAEGLLADYERENGPL